MSSIRRISSSAPPSISSRQGFDEKAPAQRIRRLSYTRLQAMIFCVRRASCADSSVGNRPHTTMTSLRKCRPRNSVGRLSCSRITLPDQHRQPVCDTLGGTLPTRGYPGEPVVYALPN